MYHWIWTTTVDLIDISLKIACTDYPTNSNHESPIKQLEKTLACKAVQVYFTLKLEVILPPMLVTYINNKKFVAPKVVSLGK